MSEQVKVGDIVSFHGRNVSVLSMNELWVRYRGVGRSPSGKAYPRLSVRRAVFLADCEATPPTGEQAELGRYPSYDKIAHERDALLERVAQLERERERDTLRATPPTGEQAGAALDQLLDRGSELTILVPQNVVEHARAELRTLRASLAAVSGLDHAILRTHPHRPDSCSGCERAEAAINRLRAASEGGRTTNG